MIRLFALLSLALGLHAQVTLSVAQAVEKAFATHPLLAEARQRVASAEGLHRQAGLAPNPRLLLQSENTRIPVNTPFVYGRDTDNFALLSQTFEWGGKRTRRVEAAAAGIERARQELEVLRRQIAMRVRRAYWEAAGARRMHELLLANLRTFQQIVDYHEIRVKEGAMAEGDLLRVRLEADRFALQANLAQLEAARARIRLFQEMGQIEFPQTDFIDPLEIAEDRLILADPEKAVEQRAEVAVARMQLEQARAGLRLAQSEVRPSYDALFGYKRTNGFDTIVGGLEIALPFRNRNQGNIEAAAADIRAAEANLAAVQALVRAEVLAANAEYEIRRRQVTEFLGRFREQANETSRIAQAAYRLGGADLLRLLDAERVRIEIELINYRALMEYRQSIVTLETAMGVQP
jgi:cobalt-zinc-cadmium efflux system outer membrane protein